MRSPFFGVGLLLFTAHSASIAGPVTVLEQNGPSHAATPTEPSIHLQQSPFVVVQGPRHAISTLETMNRSDLIVPFNQNRWLARADLGADLEAGRLNLPSGITVHNYDPAHLVDRSIRARFEAGVRGNAGPSDEYWIIPTDRKRPARRRISTRVLAEGGSAGLVESDGLIMRASLTPRGLADLVMSGEILWVEPWVAPETDSSLVREFGGANAVELVEGYLGTGVVVEVVDKGLFQNHNDLLASDPVLRTLNEGPTDHGTATYGIIFGNGETQAAARGMMPGQHGLFSSYLEIEDRDDHLASFVSDFDGAIQSNSWGSGVNRRYTAPSAAMDDSVIRHGVLIFQSQSNRGNPDSRPEAWAKNAISVGGINGHGTLDRADDTWAGDASTGPAIDGRVKPDLVLFNDGILTTSDVGAASHMPFTGTSAATPAVAGHAGIMYEMWRSGVFHGGDPLAVPADRPSVAMARAIMINSAEPYPFAHVADDLGRYRQGWGTPDLLNMWSRAPRTAVFDEADTLAEGDAWVRTFEVAPGEARLGFTLAWTDPPALPFASRTLINDLDLRVISPSGVVYLGNAGLHDGIFSVAQDDDPAVPDRVNTVENVFVASPEPGRWQVEIVADAVALDTDPQSIDPRTRFAFIATGVDPTPGTIGIRIVGEIPRLFPVRDHLELQIETHGFTPRGDGEVRFLWNNTIGGFPLVQTTPDRFSADLSGFECGLEYEFGVTVMADDGRAITYPPDASASKPVAVGANRVRTEPNQTINWSTDAELGVDAGLWERGAPVGGGLRWDPPFDADGDGLCWMTDNRAGSSGVSGGAVTLTSAPFSFEVLDNAAISYDLWLASDSASLPEEDTMLVEVSTDFGQTWSTLATERSSFRWQRRVHPFEIRQDGVLMVRFTVSDGADGSHVEAGIDGLALVGETCPPCRGDIDGNGAVDLADLSDFLTGYSIRSTTADLDDNGTVDLADLIRFVTDFQTRCR